MFIEGYYRKDIGNEAATTMAEVSTFGAYYNFYKVHGFSDR